jgi:hypothetical protein
MERSVQIEAELRRLQLAREMRMRVQWLQVH